MFDNIGGKIKTLAKVICWIGIVMSVLAAIYVFSLIPRLAPLTGYGTYTGMLILFGFTILVVGPLTSWLGSFYMYGFGELIETNSTIVKLLRRSGTGNAGEPKIPTDFHLDL